MLRCLILGSLVLFVLMVAPASSAPEQVTLTGGATFEAVKYDSSPLDAAGRGRVKRLRSVAVAPAPIPVDTPVLTDFIGLLREKTGWHVHTPRDFARTAGEVGESPMLVGGLTEDQQNAVARKVGGKLGTDGIIVSSFRGSEWKYYPSLLPIVLGERWEQSETLKMRLVRVSNEGILWSQGMDYKVTPM